MGVHEVCKRVCTACMGRRVCAMCVGGRDMHGRAGATCESDVVCSRCVEVWRAGDEDEAPMCRCVRALCVGGRVLETLAQWLVFGMRAEYVG